MDNARMARVLGAAAPVLSAIVLVYLGQRDDHDTFFGFGSERVPCRQWQQQDRTHRGAVERQDRRIQARPAADEGRCP